MPLRFDAQEGGLHYRLVRDARGLGQRSERGQESDAAAGGGLDELLRGVGGAEDVGERAQQLAVLLVGVELVHDEVGGHGDGLPVDRLVAVEDALGVGVVDSIGDGRADVRERAVNLSSCSPMRKGTVSLDGMAILPLLRRAARCWKNGWKRPLRV